MAKHAYASLLSRQHHYVLPGALITYVILQYLVGMKYQVCSPYREPVSRTTETIFYCSASCFAITIIQQLIKIFSYQPYTLRGEVTVEMSRSLFFAALTISFIAGSSSILTASIAYGGICIDVFGVESVAGQWAEWFVTVPLITYVTIAVEDKDRLENLDYLLIFSCLMCIICGFCMNNVGEFFFLGLILFVFAWGSIVATVIAINRAAVLKLQAIPMDSMINDDNKELTSLLKMRSMSLLLLLNYPAFALVHLFGYIGILDRDGVFIGYQLCGVLTKILFVGNLTEAHLVMFESINLQLSALKLANDTRRSFLRFVFHEVRFFYYFLLIPFWPPVHNYDN
jgi:hypothetical protein